MMARAAAALREAQRRDRARSRASSTSIGYLPDHVIVSGFLVTPVVAFVQPGFELLLDSREVESTFEVPVSFLFAPAESSDALADASARVEYEIDVIDIPYGEHNIWGATAGMIFTLLSTVHRRRVPMAEMTPARSSACEVMKRLRESRTAAVRGISSRRSRRSRRTRSKKPTKSPTRSSRAIRTHIRDELGDLLFQVVFHARMAEEQGWFDFDAVATAIHDKLVRRHPHVFAEHRVRDRRGSVGELGRPEGAGTRRVRQASGQ